MNNSVSINCRYSNSAFATHFYDSDTFLFSIEGTSEEIQKDCYALRNVYTELIFDHNWIGTYQMLISILQKVIIID